MTVPNVKVTMFFVSGTVGWDESHYYIPIVPITDAGLATAALALATKRCSCLDGVNSKLVDVRWSLDNVNRDVVHIKRELIPVPDQTTGYFSIGGPNYSVTSWLFQTPQVAWPILFDTTDSVIDSILYVTGMPANSKQIGPGPTDVSAGSGVVPYLKGYADYLNASNLWGALGGRKWPTTTFTPADGNPLTAPPAWAAAVGGGVPTLQVIATNAFAPVPTVGSYVRLGGLKWQNHFSRQRFNHSYQILSIAGLTLTLAIPGVKYDPVFLTKGYLQTRSQGVVNYQTYSLRNLTHRKRGRPTYSPRGRR